MLLLGGNVAGNFQLKPLLVYLSENLHALKGCPKPNLPVVWHSYKGVWVTTSLFQEWFVHFWPAVERYYAQYSLLYKALLILDSAPGHPGSLDDLWEHVCVGYTLLPPSRPVACAGSSTCWCCGCEAGTTSTQWSLTSGENTAF